MTHSKMDLLQAADHSQQIGLLQPADHSQQDGFTTGSRSLTATWVYYSQQITHNKKFYYMQQSFHRIYDLLQVAKHSQQVALLQAAELS